MSQSAAWPGLGLARSLQRILFALRQTFSVRRPNGKYFRPHRTRSLCPVGAQLCPYATGRAQTVWKGMDMAVLLYSLFTKTGGGWIRPVSSSLATATLHSRMNEA